MDYKTLPIPPLPSTQALSSASFRPPPLDGSMTLPEMYDWHFTHSPGHPVLLYTTEEGGEKIISWENCARAIYRVANEVQRRIGREPNAKNQPPTVVVIVAAVDTITYFLNIAGIFRSGYIVFPISPRNSPAAVAHLLQKGTVVSHILIGAEPASQSLVSNALQLLDVDIRDRIGKSALPTFDEMCDLDGTNHCQWSDHPPNVSFDLDCVALILHSSGSTAFPKPVYWTHYRLVQLAYCPYFGEHDMCGTRFACHSMPMFHGMGVMQTGWTAATGLIITGFDPRIPGVLPNPDTIIESSIASKSDIIFCVPSFIEAWSRNPQHVSSLSNVHGVLYGGGPLNEDIGNKLSDEGVSIFILYGCTEIGIMCPIIPKPVKRDWNYFCLAGNIKGKLREDGHGHYELVILPNPYEVPSVFNTLEDGEDAYATNDLLTPHPTKAGYWKIHGRVDDQIMHSNGEKTNPGPLEMILNQDPHIRSSVMFGRGRFYAGVIIDPKSEYAIDPINLRDLAKFRQTIWPTVERMNDFAPQHSRIFKEMIIVVSPSKPFTYTAKNTARRQVIIEDYVEEIDAIYTAVEESTQANIPLPPSWSFKHALEFTRKTVQGVMKLSIGDDADLFRHGCDSLQATWIRNTVLNALQKSTDLKPGTMPFNFVYQNPSIMSLAYYVSHLLEENSNSTQQNDAERQAREMESMVDKYARLFRQHLPSAPSPSADVVLLTGTTGGLGCLLLTALLKDPNVQKVYALNRDGGSLHDRQTKALKERGLDPDILNSPKLTLLYGKLDVRGFGLDTQTFDTIRSSITHIIHNAYPVNFNMALSSFEASIYTLRHVIDLALSSPLPDPPRVLFTSSISVVRHELDNEPVPEKYVDFAAAEGSGYSESKWVCEKLLEIASSRTSLRPITVRIGQLSGMTNGGYWNQKEWMPALIKSSVYIGCLPNLDTDVSWLPIDIAAEVIAELRNSVAPVLHLAHPHPVPWSSVFQVASQELQLPLVPYNDWFRALTSDDQSLDVIRSVDLLTKNPALRIVDFFRTPVENTEAYGEALGMRSLALNEALNNSVILRRMQEMPLSDVDVKKWIAAWSSSGFLSL
ncbi:acetyl-CoA synthetase-like protein [Sanghuangporus baumii]|uniref:Acetyl-CoA synthetase-like protein n=1 Tax=Sanghuangporus baumii TaxID=108892 RepID=A0A9Q5I5M8_SANBA|nr:acetyl-CoA synthetase-like protein [Sanghuangporus baumii]